MRLTAFLQYAAVIIGVIAALAGQFFGYPKALHLGVFMAGAGFALAGFEALVTRRMAFRPSDEPYENYAGTPALIVGVMALAIGAATIGAAYLLDNDQWHSTVSTLTRRPAPVLALGGLFLIGLGVLAMLNPQGRTSWGWRILIYLPRSLFGLALVATGLAAIGLGVWEWFDPQASHAFMKALPRRLRDYIGQP